MFLKTRTLITVTGILLAVSCSAAMGQLSRARRAVRPTAPPVAAPAPTVHVPTPAPAPTVHSPTPASDPEPPAASPAPVAASQPAAPQPARAVPRRSPSPASRPSASSDRPQGRLSRVRQQVRPQPVSLPSDPQPTPAPSPRPTPPRPQPRPPRQGASRRPRANCGPLRYRGFAVSPTVGFGAHFHHSTSSCPQPVVVPVCPEVIVQEVAPPPVRLLDERLMADTSVAPAPVECAPVVSPDTVLTPPAPRPEFLAPPCWERLEFLPFPYAHGAPGVMSYGTHKSWAGSARFEYGTSFDGLDRRGFGLLLEHESRFGFDFQWDSFEEDLGGGFKDELRLTDLNLMFRIAQNENYLVRAGLGANILDDAFGTDSGFNVTAKADFFPAEPLVMSAELDLGTIGQAEYFHAAARVGLMLDRFELFSGYDYRSIGGVALQGTLFGVQVWY